MITRFFYFFIFFLPCMVLVFQYFKQRLLFVFDRGGGTLKKKRCSSSKLKFYSVDHRVEQIICWFLPEPSVRNLGELEAGQWEEASLKYFMS